MSDDAPRSGRLDAPDPARLLASLNLAVVLLRPGLVVHAVNGAGEQLLGQARARLIGKCLFDIVRFAEPRLTEMMTNSEAQILARDVTAQLASHRADRLQVGVTPVLGWPGWQILTLLKSAEVESLPGEGRQDRDDAMLRVPAILAHEIKNPLAGIRGAAQLLGRRVSEADRALTGLIASEVDRVAALIDRMQTLSSRATEPEGPLNLHVAVHRARAVMQAASDERIEIVEEFDPSLPEIWASEDILVQVVLNLLSNAAEAVQSARRPRIVLRTRFAGGIHHRPGGQGAPMRLPIEIRVSDNGPGVDPQLRDHIFEPFVSSRREGQGGGQDQGQGQGQGLGLALVRKLVRDMHGRITHDREETAGLTHFRVHLPLAEDVARAGIRAGTGRSAA